MFGHHPSDAKQSLLGASNKVNAAKKGGSDAKSPPTSYAERMSAKEYQERLSVRNDAEAKRKALNAINIDYKNFQSKAVDPLRKHLPSSGSPAASLQSVGSNAKDTTTVEVMTFNLLKAKLPERASLVQYSKEAGEAIMKLETLTSTDETERKEITQLSNSINQLIIEVHTREENLRTTLTTIANDLLTHLHITGRSNASYAQRIGVGYQTLLAFTARYFPDPQATASAAPAAARVAAAR